PSRPQSTAYGLQPFSQVRAGCAVRSNSPSCARMAARDSGPQAAPEGLMTESFAQLFEESLASQKIQPGAIPTGRAVEVGPGVVRGNADVKSEAGIPVEQVQTAPGGIEVSVGDDVEVALDSVEDGWGETRLSREKAKRAGTWSRLEQ